MSLDPITSTSGAGFTPAMLAASRWSDTGPRATPAKPSQNDVSSAAKQFESILIRQLLAPAIEPMMSGSLGGGSTPGGGVYSYLMTDVLASSITEGGGLGLSGILESQLSPRAEKSAPETHE
jgi:peptidoglycan hydrolase FlgJ